MMVAVLCGAASRGAVRGDSSLACTTAEACRRGRERRRGCVHAAAEGAEEDEEGKRRGRPMPGYLMMLLLILRRPRVTRGNVASLFALGRRPLMIVSSMAQAWSALRSA